MRIEADSNEGLRFSLNIWFKTINIAEMDQGFSKKERLLKRKEFQLVFDKILGFWGYGCFLLTVEAG